MDNRPAKPSIPVELQALMDAKFEFKGFKSVDRLIDLQTTLTGKVGVLSVEFLVDKLAVRYDAEEITEADIRELITQAGFEIATAENAPLAPPIESAEPPRASETE